MDTAPEIKFARQNSHGFRVNQKGRLTYVSGYPDTPTAALSGPKCSSCSLQVSRSVSGPGPKIIPL